MASICITATPLLQTLLSSIHFIVFSLLFLLTPAPALSSHHLQLKAQGLNPPFAGGSRGLLLHPPPDRHENTCQLRNSLPHGCVSVNNSEAFYDLPDTPDMTDGT